MLSAPAQERESLASENAKLKAQTREQANTLARFEANALLAIEMLSFPPGEWEIDHQLRHYKEHMQSARLLLAKINPDYKESSDVQLPERDLRKRKKTGKGSASKPQR